MCTGLELLLGATAAGGAVASGMAARSDAELQSEISAMNAHVAETTAKTQRVLSRLPGYEARLEEARLRDTIAATIGGEVAAFSAANLDPAAGAPLLAIGFSAAQGEVDAGLIRTRAELRSAEILADAASSSAGGASASYDAAAAAKRANDLLVATIFGAGTAMLSGLTPTRPAGTGSITLAAPAYNPGKSAFGLS